MERNLLLVEKMVNESEKIPNELKGIVSAICKGYIRCSNGMISMDGIENVCNTDFIKVDENDKLFATENNFFGSTDTQVLGNGNLKHTMSYVDASDKVKLVMILTHELGHVMTEYKVNTVLEDGSFPFMKRTGTYYFNSYYENGDLKAKAWYGFRLSDEFLETICGSIFRDEVFRNEMKTLGFDLGDFIYKDPRLFSSRIYDEFRDCFQLFDEIMEGKLFEFACMNKETNEEYISFINNHRIHVVYGFIDKTLESLWKLKKYENIPRDENFDLLVGEYFENKKELLMVSSILSENLANKDKIDRLSLSFADLSKFGNSLPFSDKELNYFNEVISGHGR